jgi:PAS domain S-box-containing protein
MSRDASTRVALSFLLAAALALIALALIGLQQVKRLESASDWVLHSRDVLAGADAVRQLMLSAESAAREYALSANKQALERYTSPIRELPAARERLTALVQDNERQAQRVASLQTLLDVRLANLKEILQHQQSQSGQRMLAASLGDEMTREIVQAFADVRAAEHDVLTTRLNEAKVERRYVQAALVLLGAIGAAFVMLAWRYAQNAYAKRAAAERMARMGEARLFSTLQSCGDGLIVTDEAGKVTMINPVAEALTGWRLDQARGVPLDEVFRIVNEFTRETVESPVSRVLREGKIVGLANHTVLLARDGTERPIDDSGAPIRADGDETIGVVLVFRDVTARKLSEQARERLRVAEAERESAVKANEMKDQFLALVSHELRSPLAAIHGWVTLLIQGGIRTEDTRDALQRISRNVRQQQRVISDLLDVSRIVAGKLEILRSPVDLVGIVHSVVDECRHAAKTRGVSLSFREPQPSLFLLGDEQRLIQAIGNVLGNGIKFTPSGGKVEVRLERLGASALIEIADNGIGMTTDVLEHLFERFWQAETVSTRSQGGLGLGLAISKHIIEQHDGSINASSAGLDMGSTFTIKLPLIERDSEPSSGNDGQAAMQTNLAGISILVVEDDVDSRDAIAMFLKMSGATVTAVSSVKEALETYERNSPRVIVTDLGMPGADGFSLASEVRRMDAARGRRTPLIALTGFVGAKDRSEVLKAGFAAHLEKPVNFALLVEQIRSLARQ